MRIEVDCERIRRNTKAIVKVCAERNIEVAGVTKACCGHHRGGTGYAGQRSEDAGRVTILIWNDYFLPQPLKRSTAKLTFAL